MDDTETKLHPDMPVSCRVLRSPSGRREVLWDGEAYELKRTATGLWVNEQCVFHGGRRPPRGGY